MRTVTGILAAAAIGLLASTALATHNQPFKGKSFKVNLMTAYEPCAAPDTVTDDAVSACSVPVRSDPTCGYGGGQGRIQLKMLTVGKVAFKVKLTTLEAGCEGQVLHFVTTLRRTGHHCGGTACTVVDATDFEFASCVVQGATCVGNGQVLFPGGVNLGQIEFKDISVKRAGLRTFDTGIVNSNSLS